MWLKFRKINLYSKRGAGVLEESGVVRLLKSRFGGYFEDIEFVFQI